MILINYEGVRMSETKLMENASKTIKEQIKEYSVNHLNQTFSTDDIKKELNEKYATPFNSVIPTDYCYNCTNKGINFDLSTRFFEKIEGGLFKSLGPNYSYTGTVLNKKEIFGTWENGIFTLKNDYAESLLPVLFEQFLNYKNSSDKYDEQYKWDYAKKYEGQFRNLDNLIEKLSTLEPCNFQSFFIRNSGIRWLVSFAPEKLIESFSALFNNNDDLTTRIENFRSIIKETLLENDGWKNKNLADPGVDTAAFFLFADNYCSNLLFTKMKPFNNYAKQLRMGNLLKFNSGEERYIAWQQYCVDTLIPAMNDYYKTENTLLDAQDFIWFVGNMENSETESLEEDTTKYWMLAAGRNGDKWEDFKTNSIIAIGWDELGSLSQYPTREDMKQAIITTYNETNPKNNSLATWQFANDIKIGDIVFIKSSRTGILGRGIVESDYIFDDSRADYKNIRKVNWTHIDKSFEYESKWAVKTLTDITPYTEDVKKLESQFDIDVEETEEDFESYSKEDFLSDVFMDEEKYELLKNLLLNKKNIILQGSPGVGKTYSAKRLAYSILGKKDSSKVKMVQFHQSYGYEDFVMGYRPSENGFELKEGPFYEFCKNAEKDIDNKYFFIIDEINRGKLSKILGELLMLIETDKRGTSLRLLYKDEQFTVPKNVYIIGMMNTADRSLAMMDYALRRRFSFFEFEPAFETDSFKRYQLEKNNDKYSALIQEIIKLNKTISDDPCLGNGFTVGHSYFCTNKNTIDDEWLRAVVDFELAPLLKEYWFDEPEKYNTWIQKLKATIK